MAGGIPGRKVNVLVIEDNAADVELLRMALAQAALDCELTVIADGAEVLEMLKHEGKDSAMAIPDIVVIDLNLPRYDGTEILEAMRAHPAFNAVPVVVVSSSSWPRERARLQALGVARYITKPAELDEYLEIGLILRDLLHDSGSGGTRSGPAGADPSPGA
jgi:CheY-like chemotaxis protein